MFIYAIAFAAAQASASTPAPAAVPTVQAAQPAEIKKKKRKHRSCETGEMSLGSHIVMDTCPESTEQTRSRDLKLYQQSIVSSKAPGSPE